MYWKSHYHVKSHTLVKKLKHFYGIIENDSDDKVSLFEKSALIQLVSKNIQLGSARFQKSASSAQLGKIQLGSARLSSPISSSVASLVFREASELQ